MRKIPFFAQFVYFLLFCSFSAQAQIQAPQIGLSGNIGCVGFPCVNTGTLIFSSDANHTMTVQETSAFYLRVTSSVTLTATRNLIAPSGRFPFTIENATTGGQSIQIIGQSGLGVTIPNGATVSTWNDSANFVQIGGFSLTTTGSSGAAVLNGVTLNIPQYQGVLTLTTTGSSGAASLVGSTLNIPQYASSYTLPIATSDTLGGVKGGGSGIAIDATTGVISATGASGFTSGSNANGWWIKDPTGHIRQGGHLSGETISCNAITFPIAFTTTTDLTPTVSDDFAQGSSVQHSAVVNASHGCTEISTTTMYDWVSSTGGNGVWWTADGQ